ncbi:MAG: hypothetical protein ABII90_07225 [Bacteroidota bacterium]
MPGILAFILQCSIVLTLFSHLSAMPGQPLNEQVDSLENLLKTAEGDTDEVNILNALAWKLRSVESQRGKAEIYARKGLNLARKLKYRNGIANINHTLGSISSKNGNYWMALEYYFRVVMLNGEMNDIKGLASAYNNIGLIYKILSDYPQALKYLYRSLQMD